jgi:hypothetical protein
MASPLSQCQPDPTPSPQFGSSHLQPETPNVGTWGNFVKTPFAVHDRRELEAFDILQLNDSDINAFVASIDMLGCTPEELSLETVGCRAVLQRPGDDKDFPIFRLPLFLPDDPSIQPVNFFHDDHLLLGSNGIYHLSDYFNAIDKHSSEHYQTPFGTSQQKTNLQVQEVTCGWRLDFGNKYLVFVELSIKFGKRNDTHMPSDISLRVLCPKHWSKKMYLSALYSNIENWGYLCFHHRHWIARTGCPRCHYYSVNNIDELFATPSRNLFRGRCLAGLIVTERYKMIDTAQLRWNPVPQRISPTE